MWPASGLGMKIAGKWKSEMCLDVAAVNHVDTAGARDMAALDLKAKVSRGPQA